MMFDLILSGGVIYDGSGAPPFRADIAIKDKKIILIAPSIVEPAFEKRDVSSFWICPGFVDIHTHYDAEVEIKPDLSESVRHGVTSLVMGNCSLSLGIGSPHVNGDLFERVETMPELITLWKQQAKKWPNTKSYLSFLEQLPLGPNVGCLLGHSALRAEVMGLKRSLTEKATPTEINVMKLLAQEALDAGCIGISIDMVHWHRTTGLYPGHSLPSHHAGFEEYAMLAALCRERDAVFQVTPNPKKLWPSILAIIRLSYGIVRAPLRCTILSAMDMTINKHAWRAFPAFSTICNQFLGCNIRFQTIPEPFTIYSDGPITPLFEEFETGAQLNSLKTSIERKAQWQSSEFKKRFKQQWNCLKGRTFDGDFAKIILIKAPQLAWQGKSLQDIAQSMNEDPLTLFISLLETQDTALRWKHTGANHREAIRHKLLKHPYILPGFSDAGAHCRNIAFFDSALSLLKQSVQSQFIPPEQAIKRVTYEPAKWFNLAAGQLKMGAKADLVILDPQKLNQPITMPNEYIDATLLHSMRMIKQDSHSPIESVYIAGQEVISQGNPHSSLGKKKTGTILKSTVPVMGLQPIYERYRNRINHELLDHPFTNYWDIFILKHQQKYNVLFHCIAFFLMYTFGILSIATQNLWFLLLMPLSQLTGLVGHFCFERSSIDQRDTAFSFRAFISLHKLFFHVLTGQYHHETERVQKALACYQASKT
ncbi:amidohydrolase family protein [Candidatus Berkiella aquae]|uniref:Amidohydrolase family protein n=1 Tax=Candidatus Berkiella aquae TaxID=295108 RepID=A0A0Q9YYB5_9GAMM|nr:amidohydrolase family protein [Candidatus Berkiella aquae]MCS5710323.1 amidohydrolase family protein [Candidatus Berkiella aquae]